MRSSFWCRVAAPKKAAREAPAEDAQASLKQAITAPVIAAKSGGYKRVVPSKPEGREEELRYSTVAGRDRVIRRFQRRVKSDTQSVVPRYEHPRRIP